MSQTAGDHQDDRRLIAGVVSGEAGARPRFLQRAADTIWSTVAVFLGEGPEAKEAFKTVIEALSANHFARLGRYDGRASLETFLVLATRECLAEQTARLFSEKPNLAWRRFARFFDADIRRRVRKYFDRAREEDIYQEVVLRLIDDDYRRIRGYKGHGSFTCYILATVNNLLVDLLRIEARRRRLPAEVKRLSPLHQAVFIAAVWNATGLDVDRMRLALSGKFQPDPSPDEIRAVIDRLSGLIATARGAGARPEEISIDSDAGQEASLSITDTETAESRLIEAEEQRTEDALLDRVRREAETLPAEERLFLQIVMQASDPLPSREIAKLMALPVEEIYRLRQRTTRWLKQMAGDPQKNHDASV